MSCDWPVNRDCLPALPVLPDTPTGEQQLEYDLAKAKREAAIDLAVQVMWALSGRQFGTCPVTVRPCPAPPYIPESVRQYLPLIWNGDNWQNVSCGCAGGRCVESGPGVVHLPGPVGEILEVRIAGEVLPADEYILSGSKLYRLGGQAWPSQDRTRADGMPGTWAVDYTQGMPVPDGVGILTGLLAKEFISACGGGKCRLPRNVTQVSRQGVSYTMYDPAAVYASGKTGLSEIDIWLMSVNPHRLSEPPRVI